MFWRVLQSHPKSVIYSKQCSIVPDAFGGIYMIRFVQIVCIVSQTHKPNLQQCLSAIQLSTITNTCQTNVLSQCL